MDSLNTVSKPSAQEVSAPTKVPEAEREIEDIPEIQKAHHGESHNLQEPAINNDDLNEIEEMQID